MLAAVKAKLNAGRPPRPPTQHIRELAEDDPHGDPDEAESDDEPDFLSAGSKD